MTSYGDLLSSESLLFAIVGIVLALWYPDIVAAIDATIPDQPADFNPVRKQVTEALKGKALPLALTSACITAVFLPTSVLIVSRAIRFLHANGLSVPHYDPVQTAVVLVTALSLLLTVYLFSLVRSLASKLKELPVQP
jgi:hypothetical protein